MFFKCIFKAFFALGASLTLLVCSEEKGSVYSQIKDINHPTLEDYRLIQAYISRPDREDLKRLNDLNYEHVARSFKMIGKEPDEIPKFETIAVNTTLEDKNNCVLIYASYNRNYPLAAKRLVDLIKASDFKGHILYRVGGWPNTKNGSLVLAHVPYAFKACFFKEALHSGYKKAFWLDTAAIPVVSLNEIFKLIEEKGYFIMGNSHLIGPYMNAESAKAFGLTLEQTNLIPSCSSGILGVDFTTDKGRKIIDSWYKAAEDKDAFFSRRPDQSALSIILFQMGIQDFVSIEKMPHTEIGEKIKPDSLFLLDRIFSHRF